MRPPYDGTVTGTRRRLDRPVRAAARVTGLGPSPFSRLATAHLFSMGGDALVTMALAGSLFFSISPKQAQGRVALSLVLTMAPFAVVAPFLGPAVDRVQGGRRFMVLATAVGRAVSCLFMARYVHGLLLFPAAFATLVFSKAYTVAKSALVPAVVESDDELVSANSKLTMGAALIGLIASIPGVAILKLLDAAALLRFASAVFVGCAIASLRIVPARQDRKPPPEERETHVRSRGIVLAAMVTGVLRAVVGFLTFLLAFDFRRTHAPSVWFGVALLASVGGGLLGAAVAPKLRGAIREEHIVLSALVLVVAGGLGGAQVGGRWGAALAALAVGVASGAGKLAFDSLVQRDAPDAAYGRSFARFEAAFQLAWVAGALVPVVLTVPAGVGLTLMAIASLAAGVAYLVGRARSGSARPGPPAPPGRPRPAPVDEAAPSAPAAS
jgi:hypothetical protein